MTGRRAFLALAASIATMGAGTSGAAAQSFLRDAFGGAANRPRSGGPTIPRGGSNSSNGGHGGNPGQRRNPQFSPTQRPRGPRP
jgi:hypothetical protein